MFRTLGHGAYFHVVRDTLIKAFPLSNRLKILYSVGHIQFFWSPTPHCRAPAGLYKLSRMVGACQTSADEQFHIFTYEIMRQLTFLSAIC